MEWSNFEDVINASSLLEVKEAASAYCSSVGFEHHGFAMRHHPSMFGMESDGFLAFCNYGGEGSHQFPRLRSPKAAADARVGHSRTSLPAVGWNVHGDVAYTSARHRKLWAEGRDMMAQSSDFGIRGGITVPCRGSTAACGFLCTSTDRTDDIRELMQPVAELSYFVSCM